MDYFCEVKKSGSCRKVSMVRQLAQKLASIVMIVLLLFLTTVNYFIYSGKSNTAQTALQQATGSDEGTNDGDYGNRSNPAGPDEKSPGNPVNISEEYIHHQDEQLNHFCFDSICMHRIADAEKLTIVHFERLSPPPEA